jgi:RES domain-containing protein
MFPAAKLRVVLRIIPATAMDGPWVRAVDARSLAAAPPGEPAGGPPNPLWGGGARLYGGRFTPIGSFDTIYLASNLETAAREIGAVTDDGERPSPSKDPFTVVHVTGHLEGVLDLRDAATQAVLGTDPLELASSWRHREVAPTQELGAAVRASGRLCAIVAPSAAGGSGFVVAVFVDRMSRAKGTFLESVDASGALSRRLP